MKRIFVALLIILLLQLPTAALVWLDMGHMTIAAAAYAKFDPATRAPAAELLKLNPNYYQWVAGVPDGRREIVVFIRVATWRDDIKGRREYHSQSVTQDGEHANDNIGYSDFLVHPYCH